MSSIVILADLSDSSRMQLLYALAGLMALIIVGFVGMLILRRKLKATDEIEAAPMGFSLADLRTLRDRGELTPEEFEHAKSKIVANMKKKLEENPPKMPKRKGPLPPGMQLPDEDNP